MAGLQGSVSVLVHLKIFVVKLLLSLVELPQLLRLAFAELLSLRVMSGKTLRTGNQESHQEVIQDLIGLLQHHKRKLTR